MEFFVYETGETVKAERRPLVILTSNNEKVLPDAFLRLCSPPRMQTRPMTRAC